MDDDGSRTAFCQRMRGGFNGVAVMVEHKGGVMSGGTVFPCGRVGRLSFVQKKRAGMTGPLLLVYPAK